MVTANYLSYGQAARNLGVMESQLRAIARRRPELPRIQVGRVAGIAPEAMEAWRAALIEAGFLPRAVSVAEQN
jgi:hypothetical protein